MNWFRLEGIVYSTEFISSSTGFKVAFRKQTIQRDALPDLQWFYSLLCLGCIVVGPCLLLRSVRQIRSIPCNHLVSPPGIHKVSCSRLLLQDQLFHKQVFCPSYLSEIFLAELIVVVRRKTYRTGWEKSLCEVVSCIRLIYQSTRLKVLASKGLNTPFAISNWIPAAVFLINIILLYQDYAFAFWYLESCSLL